MLIRPGEVGDWASRPPVKHSIAFRARRESAQAQGLVSWWPISLKPKNVVGGDIAAGPLSLMEFINDRNLGVLWRRTSGDETFTFTNIPDVFAGNGVTVSFWLRTTHAGADTIVGFYQNSGLFPGFGVGLNNVTAGKVWYHGGTGAGSVAGTTTVNDGVLRHIALTVQGTTVTFYINGEVESTTTGQQPTAYAGTRGLLCTNTGGNAFQGDIADIRIHNRALPASTIRAIYAPQSRWDLYEPIEIPSARLAGPSVSPTTPLQRVTQVVLLYGYNRYADADPPPTESACTGGGTVASGTNPTDGSSIATATSLHAVFRITVNGTTYDFSQTAINHGSRAKTPRVDKFGRFRRALPDDDGSIELPSVWVDFFDHDNLMRGWHDTQTLKGLTAEILLADETTWQAGGANAQVRFSGVVERFEPLPGYRYRITLESPLAPAFSETAQETLLPRETISISDGTADQALRNSPAPHLYGSLSEEGGCIEIPFVGTETPATDPTLGNRHKHLFGFGAIGSIEGVYGADPLSGDPPTRRAALPASAFTSDFLAPHISGADWFEAANYSVQDSARWTFGFLEQTHPAADLARYGRIPLTANVCGRETTGNATGSTIDRAGRQALLVLNTAWANSVGDANHPAMATRNGFSIFNTQSFETWQTTTANNSGIANGYKGAFALGHSHRFITLRTFIEQAYVSWLLEMYINRWGQVAAAGLDRTATASGVPHDNYALHIKKDSFSIDDRRNAVENATRYVYRRKYAKTLEQLTPVEGSRLPSDAFQEDWLSGIQEVTNSTSITALGGSPRGRRESPILEMELTRDEDTADDVAQQRNDLRAPANGRAEATYAIQMQRLDTAELGDLRKVTHPQALGTSGWSAQRVQIRAIEEDWNAYAMCAWLTVRDVDDLLA